MTLQVTLINFGDSPRVFYDVNGRARHCIPGGILKDFEMSERGLQRVKRDDTMVTVSGDVLDNNKSGLLSGLLDTLANWANLSMEEKQTRTERVFGVGALGQRPSDYEMRHALAIRAKEAAMYIQQGSLDTADEVLGARLPPRDVQLKALADAKAAAKANDPMFVKGDDEESDEGSGDVGSASRKLEPIGSDDASSGDGDRSGAAELVRAESGPGLTLPPTDGGNGESDRDRPGLNHRPVRKARERRDPEPAPQPARVKRKKNPPRVARKRGR